MGLVYEIYSLNRNIVGIFCQGLGVIGKLLDVHDRYFRLAFPVLRREAAADNLCKIILGLNRIDLQSTV